MIPDRHSVTSHVRCLLSPSYHLVYPVTQGNTYCSPVKTSF